MKSFKSTSALFMLLLVPCSMFGGVSDVASSVASVPGRVFRGLFSAAQYTVDGVARAEGAVVKGVMSPFVAATKAGSEFLQSHEQAIFRLMSLATLAGAGYYVQKLYKKNCPLACKKSCSKAC